MISELFKRIDTSQLYPTFYLKLEQLAEACLARGVQYYAISGYRSWEEQDKLYAKGRDKKGKIVKKDEVVTNAKGGQSNHNFSVAVDWCRDADMERSGLQPNWDKESYEILAEEAQKLGLDAGHFWKFSDSPHIQLNLARNGLSFKDLKEAYLKNEDIKDVWAFLDKYQW